MGFEVAYLSELGKFDGLKSEMSNVHESHAFLCPPSNRELTQKNRSDMYTLSNVENLGGEVIPPGVRFISDSNPDEEMSKLGSR